MDELGMIFEAGDVLVTSMKSLQLNFGTGHDLDGQICFYSTALSFFLPQAIQKDVEAHVSSD
jgi:hypothetical protein